MEEEEKLTVMVVLMEVEKEKDLVMLELLMRAHGLVLR